MTEDAHTFRPLGLFDLDLLAALHAQIFTAPWDRPWTRQSFADVLAMPGAAGLLAVEMDAPIGFGLTSAAVDEVEILLIGLLPDRRKAGKGARLLAALLADAAARGARRAILEVAETNRAAIDSYTAAGFTRCGRRAAYYPGQIDAFIFEKSL